MNGDALPGLLLATPLLPNEVLLRMRGDLRGRAREYALARDGPPVALAKLIEALKEKLVLLFTPRHASVAHFLLAPVAIAIAVALRVGIGAVGGIRAAVAPVLARRVPAAAAPVVIKLRRELRQLRARSDVLRACGNLLVVHTTHNSAEMRRV